MIVLRVLGFVGWYATELVRSYLQMIFTILRPGPGVTPSVVRLDTHCVREAEVGLLGLLITLAPGTVVLDARAHAPEAGEGSRWTLYVHGIQQDDPEDLRTLVAEYEHRLLTALGRAPGTEGAP